MQRHYQGHAMALPAQNPNVPDSPQLTLSATHGFSIILTILTESSTKNYLVQIIPADKTKWQLIIIIPSKIN